MAYFLNVRTGGIYGNDVSEYQGAVNFATMYGQNCRFAYLRTITSNPARLDNTVKANATNARAQGILCGGYHLIRPDLMGLNSAVSEADRFANGLYQAFGSDPNNAFGDLIPMVDVELPYPKPGGWGKDDYIEYCEKYINELLAQTGFYKVIVYTGRYIADSYNQLIHSKRGAILAQYPLCLTAKDPTQYTGVNTTAEKAYPNYNFDTFGGWTDWVMWQYSLDNPDVKKGATYGVASADIDIDVLKPGLTLNVLKNSTYAPPPPAQTTPTNVREDPTYIDFTPTPPNPTQTEIDFNGGIVPMPGTTNFTSVSVASDTMVSGKDVQVTASPMYTVHKEFFYTDLNAGKQNLIPALPGKQVIVEKIQLYCDADLVPTATSQLRFQTTEATPRTLILTDATRLVTTAKINTDGFSYFTEGAGTMRKKLGNNVGVDLVSLVALTAGQVTMTIYFRYV